MTTIYILRLQGGNYYVGKTADLLARLQAHMDGNGTAWTKVHKVVEVEKIIEDASPFEEDKQVKEYMSRYGIEKVRGGAYSAMILSNEQISIITKEIRGATDLCSSCGKPGHFATACFTNNAKQIKSKPKSRECYRCGREGHYAKNCFARTDIDGHSLDSEDESDYWTDDSSEDDWY